jgi:hypothetical protein
MTPLAGTQEWDPDVVKRRLLFLRQCVRHHRDLSIRLGRLSSAPDEIISFTQNRPALLRNDGLEAQLLAEAAEISLALGDTSTGVEILREVVSRLFSRSNAQAANEYDGTLQQFVMASAFSALTQRGSLRMTDKGAVIAYKGGSAFFNWNHRTEVQELVRTLPMLLSIVAFNDAAEDLGSFLAKAEYDRRFELTLTAAATKPDFVVFGLLPAIYKNEAARRRFHQLNRRDGFSALRELELGYSTRIDLLRRDIFHWKTLRPRAELIDWSLLIAQVALIRNDAMRFKIPRENETLPPTEFSRSLAMEFASLERNKIE